MRHITKAGFSALAGAFVIMAPAAGEAGVMNMAERSSIAPAVQTEQVNWRGHGYRRWGYAPRWGYSRWGYAPRWRHAHWGYAPRWGYSHWGYAPATWGYSAAAAPYCDYGAWGYNPVGGALGVAAGVATAPLWAAGAVTSPLWDSNWW